MSSTNELTLFISHSSADSVLAKLLVELFEKSLKLLARQIRCTSVDGYRLPVGADTDEQLRREIFVARAFIGIITPSSFQSAYVLFELGARWGAKRHLAPVVGRGADTGSLRGPLSGLNALDIRQRNQVTQLVEDVADYLEMRLEPAATYQAALDAVVAAANTAAPEPHRDSEESAAEPVEEIEVELLRYVAHSEGQATKEALSDHLKIPFEKVQYYTHRLIDRDLLMYDQAFYGESSYRILQKGRELLVKNGLL